MSSRKQSLVDAGFHPRAILSAQVVIAHTVFSLALKQ
jgi:hypothetical protein